jgi:protease-4
MTFERVSELAEGRVYTARQALKIGLVDEIGTLHDAIAAAKQAAGIKPEEEVEIVEYPEEKTIFELLSGDMEDDESMSVFATQFAGIPAKTLKSLNIPYFLLHPETSGKPHLYYWSGVPEVK